MRWRVVERRDAGGECYRVAAVAVACRRARQGGVIGDIDAARASSHCVGRVISQPHRQPRRRTIEVRHRHKAQAVGRSHIQSVIGRNGADAMPTGCIVVFPSPLRTRTGCIAYDENAGQTVGTGTAGSARHRISSVNKLGAEQVVHRVAWIHHRHITHRGGLVFVDRRQRYRRVIQPRRRVVDRGNRQSDHVWHRGKRSATPGFSDVVASAVGARTLIPGAKCDGFRNGAVPVRRRLKIEPCITCQQ